MNKLTVIAGGTSQLTEDLVSNISARSLIVIGRNKPSFDCRFILCDLDKSIDKKTTDLLMAEVGNNNVESFVWLVGSYKKIKITEKGFFDEVIRQFNLSTMNFLKICLELSSCMRRSQTSVVAISSTLAHRPSALSIPYNLGKASMIFLCRNLALELGAFGVRFNTISPGPFYSQMSKDLFDDSNKMTTILKRIPLSRPVSSSTVTSLVSYLLSDSSRDITGQDFIVDGGNTIGF